MLVIVAPLPPSLIPALCNIDILLHKQATQTKHFCPECIPVVHSLRLEEQSKHFLCFRKSTIFSECICSDNQEKKAIFNIQ